MVFVAFSRMGSVYWVLWAVGSEPSVVSRITVPAGEPSGTLSVRVIDPLVITFPGSLNTGSPNTLSLISPQLAAFGVGSI